MHPSLMFGDRIREYHEHVWNQQHEGVIEKFDAQIRDHLRVGIRDDPSQSSFNGIKKLIQQIEPKNHLT